MRVRTAHHCVRLQKRNTVENRKAEIELFLLKTNAVWPKKYKLELWVTPPTYSLQVPAPALTYSI
jgi:hypothetical protein